MTENLSFRSRTPEIADKGSGQKALNPGGASPAARSSAHRIVGLFLDLKPYYSFISLSLLWLCVCGFVIDQIAISKKLQHQVLSLSQRINQLEIQLSGGPQAWSVDRQSLADRKTHSEYLKAEKYSNSE